ncbi:hypothetical protein BSL82_10000 [Tardibacter chloracetimidivorans]|uniref:VRR-NUC domain-containing protein n=1 Tax=Tardibacter chloracetimidivorans TaxID=1921510 RepID=A0A1L3ZVG6_9SPHN|nr:VRR-NUC domain-containing protein [Tardibacter chloracetimidivorans]API59605.1 hypothetical protein BSL82_10000 [Tardibacter chloracetimidivorans]
MIEAAVEQHLVDRVKEVGGEVRKLSWPGRRGAPDRAVMLRQWGVILVELKRPGGKPEPHQVREHDRLRALGVPVEVLTTKQDVDDFIERRTA